MNASPIYLDNHATTRVDPRVLEAMLPYFGEHYGNAGSVGHVYGENAKSAVENARATIAASIGAEPKEIVFTSGATESNNLAIRGVAERHRGEKKHIVSVATEHMSVLDPLLRLVRSGFEIEYTPIALHGAPDAGLVDLHQLQSILRPDTLLVSVMLANNEIGAIQPIQQIGRMCKERGVYFHCDATQAVGKIPLDVNTLEVDLMSFTAHKVYGPKGVGALYIRRQKPWVRLEPLLNGGGQEGGRRSGTHNTPGIVGFAKALELCLKLRDEETNRIRDLRNRLWQNLQSRLEGVSLNGPVLENNDIRLAGNLNVCFQGVQGDALMMNVRNIAVSSGSACTSAHPEPSHVLRALGMDDDSVRSSLRFGIGRFNTQDDVDFAVEHVVNAVIRLRAMNT